MEPLGSLRSVAHDPVLLETTDNIETAEHAEGSSETIETCQPITPKGDSHMARYTNTCAMDCTQGNILQD